MPGQYEAAEAAAGEIRLYVQTAAPVDPENLRSALEYAYARGRDHRTRSDPWEYAFGDARALESEAVFHEERDRIIGVLLAAVAGEWDAELLYYPPREGSARFHWSSAEGDLRAPGRMRA